MEQQRQTPSRRFTLMLLHFHPCILFTQDSLTYSDNIFKVKYNFSIRISQQSADIVHSHLSYVPCEQKAYRMHKAAPVN